MFQVGKPNPLRVVEAGFTITSMPTRDADVMPLVRMARGHIPRRVPAAGLAPALLICISAVLPGLLRPPERPPGLG